MAESQAPLELKGAWGKLVLPNVLVIALVTILGQRCGSDPPGLERIEHQVRQNHDTVTLKLDAIQRQQVATDQRVNLIETRQSLQDARSTAPK
jgi:hypothetical protein